MSMNRADSMLHLKLRHALRLTALLFCISWAQSASALCTIVCACTASTTSLVFTPYNPLSSSNDDSTGNVSVKCGGIAGLGIPLSIAINAGTSGTMANRQMANGTNRLSYNIYTTNLMTTVWGDGSGSTGVVTGSVGLDLLGLSPPVDFPVYGRIPGGQFNVVPGGYADSLVVTLTYF